MTYLIFVLLKYTTGARVTADEEFMGADWVEHDIQTESFMLKFEKAFERSLISRKAGEADKVINTVRLVLQTTKE